MQTYVISTEMRDYIKIGKSSDAIDRLYALQTSNPHELKLEGWFEEDIEEKLHKEYRHAHKHLEWFKYDILKSIEKKNGFIKYENEKEYKTKKTNPLKPNAEYRDKMCRLTNSSMLVYCLLNYRIEKDDYVVNIVKKDYMRIADRSSLNTYKKGINELVEKNIIRQIEKDKYEINPILFGGNRITKWPEKVVIKTEM